MDGMNHDYIANRHRSGGCDERAEPRVRFQSAMDHNRSWALWHTKTFVACSGYASRISHLFDFNLGTRIPPICGIVGMALTGCPAKVEVTETPGTVIPLSGTA
jgi:hypothetical protein